MRWIRLFSLVPTVFRSIMPERSSPFLIRTTLSLIENSTVSIDSSRSSNVVLKILKLISFSGIINEMIYFPVHSYFGFSIAGSGSSFLIPGSHIITFINYAFVKNVFRLVNKLQPRRES